MSDLAAVAAEVGFPDVQAAAALRVDARSPSGRLGDLARWLAEVQATATPAAPRRARLVAFVGRHGTADSADSADSGVGVSAQTAEDADSTAARLAAETADPAGLARLVGAGVVVHRCAHASEPIDRGNAFTPEQVSDLVAAGIAAADAEVDAGADLLLPVGLGAGGTTAAATIISVLTGLEPVRVIGRGSARSPIDDQTWMRKAAVIRDARRRAMPSRHEPDALLATCGGPEITALCGFLLRAAARRTPVLLDGAVVSAAALVVQSAQPRAVRWWLAAHRTGEADQQAALDRLSLQPLLDLGLRGEDGTGPLLTLPMLAAAVAGL